jgi:hypothetical protein
MLFRLAAAELSRRPGNRVRVRRRAHEQQRGSSRGHERQTPLDSDHGRRQRLRERDGVPLGLLLLGPAPHDPYVREVAGDRLEELALARVRLQQEDLPLGERSRDGDARRAPARADVDDAAGKAIDIGRRREAFLEMDAARFRRIANRGQPRRAQQSLEPALKPPV